MSMLMFVYSILGELVLRACDTELSDHVKLDEVK